MSVIYIILVVLNIITLSYMAYYIITSLGMLFRSKKIPQSNPKAKFAVIIAARNEERVLGQLLDSLNNQQYPSALYDVFVIPNNCTDATEQVAIQKGAKIVNPDVEIKSKGEALKYTFEHFEKNNINYDAYVVFDADNVVHKNFLKVANDAYCAGIKVAQGYRDSKNPNDTWISSSFSIYHLLNNTFVNDCRSRINKSAYISGTGFMVASDIIKQHGYSVSTITEDTEFTIMCILNGYKIEFLKDAITYDEQATDFITSVKQRKRWSYGTLQCFKKYKAKLLRKMCLQSLDVLMFLLAPVFQLVAILSQIISNIPFEVIYNGQQNILVGIILSYISSVAVALITITINKKKINVKGILMFPIFILTWIPINIYVLFKKECKWEQIAHNRVITIDDVA